MHLPRFVIELELPQELGVFDIVQGEDLLVLLPGGPHGVAAVGQPVGAEGAAKGDRRSHQDSSHEYLSAPEFLKRIKSERGTKISPAACGSQAECHHAPVTSLSLPKNCR